MLIYSKKKITFDLGNESCLIIILNSTHQNLAFLNNKLTASKIGCKCHRGIVRQFSHFRSNASEIVNRCFAVLWKQQKKLKLGIGRSFSASSLLPSLVPLPCSSVLSSNTIAAQAPKDVKDIKSSSWDVAHRLFSVNDLVWRH